MSLNGGAIFLLGLMAFYGVVTEATPVKFGNCSDVTEHISAMTVDVTPCSTTPCEFKKGTNVTCTISFTPTEEVSNGTLKVYGKLGPVKVPFPLPNPNACSDHGLTCPLKSGVPVELTITLPVKSEYPSVTVVAQFELEDQSNNDVFCFQVIVKIVDAYENVEA